MDKFGSWVKLREIVRVLTRHRVPDARSLTIKLLADAEKAGSNSPFRRPVANDGETSYLVLEYDTVLAHVRFADKLGMATFRGPTEEYLPGLEQDPFEFSEAAVDARIVSFLGRHGISLPVLESAVSAIEFHDVDSIVDILKMERKLPLGEAEFRKCLLLLGECGISVRASRKKTYSIRMPLRPGK